MGRNIENKVADMIKNKAQRKQKKGFGDTKHEKHCTYNKPSVRNHCTQSSIEKQILKTNATYEYLESNEKNGTKKI